MTAHPRAIVAKRYDALGAKEKGVENPSQSSETSDLGVEADDAPVNLASSLRYPLGQPVPPCQRDYTGVSITHITVPCTQPVLVPPFPENSSRH
jgi:hypothetical protein